MARRMLIDATAPGEVRVAVVDGSRLDDYDIEIHDRKLTKGNIYLAQVTRVEPSLQAAFLNYKNGQDQRQGFLAFPEIHTDYYRIPVADREALEEYQAAERARMKEEDERFSDDSPSDDEGSSRENVRSRAAASSYDQVTQALQETPFSLLGEDRLQELMTELAPPPAQTPFHDENTESFALVPDEQPSLEGVSPDAFAGDKDDGDDRVRRRRMIRYKIQEVIKRRQIMLVQVVKEERGSKGAAVTSYISLPGRYCVLMPNSPSGGGVSRKINNQTDRRRMREILSQLNVPDGMSVILRTAGLERNIEDIKKDLGYLLRLWDQIRELTLKSTAPALIYEEGDLIRRSIRDLHHDHIQEILVAGEEAYQTARDFMNTLMPAHTDRIKLYKDAVPLFTRFDVEKQIDSVHESTVQMKSGGYIVINQTEALVAVDVNSGRATKERNIEETALRTNIEAAEEVARQIRLRDLAGLIVVDFIDMENMRNRIAVERKLKEAMKSDRARIQIGRISTFGLLELSRQRLRPSLAEIDFSPCPHCQGRGQVRSLESAARAALRALEEDCLKNRARDITLRVPATIALHLLNNLRRQVVNLEQRYNLSIWIEADDQLIAPAYKIERMEKRNAFIESSAVSYESVGTDDDGTLPAFATAISPDATWQEGALEERAPSEERGSRRRRAPRRNGRAERPGNSPADLPQSQPDVPDDAFAAFNEETPMPESDGTSSGTGRNRRSRGRRGGRIREGATPDYSKMPPLEERDFNAAPAFESAPSQPADYPEPQPPANDASHSSSASNNEQSDSSRRGWWQKLLEG